MPSFAVVTSPTTWFITLVVTHLITQSFIQGDTLQVNAFGLGVLKMIQDAPNSGERVLGNENSPALSQLAPSSTLVELTSTVSASSTSQVAITARPLSSASSQLVQTSSTPSKSVSPTTPTSSFVSSTAPTASPVFTPSSSAIADEDDSEHSDDVDDFVDDVDSRPGKAVTSSEPLLVGVPDVPKADYNLSSGDLDADDESSDSDADSESGDFDLDSDSGDSDESDVDVITPLKSERSLRPADTTVRHTPVLVKRLDRVPKSFKHIFKRERSEHDTDDVESAISESDNDSDSSASEDENVTSALPLKSQFTVPGLSDVNGQELIVTVECSKSLDWPIDLLSHYQKQNITFLFFQTWLAVLSLFALAYGSAPHLLATVICHFLALGYGIFQISSTRYFHDKFHREIVSAACAGSSLLPRYWEEVLDLQIATAIVEGALALLFVILAWRLNPIMDWAAWKLIGANGSNTRIYKFILTYRIALQICGFFIITFQALWLSEIHEVRNRGENDGFFLSRTYEILLGILTAFVPIWLLAGWLIVEGPKSKLSDGGKKMAMILRINKLGERIGWRGGKGWGLAGKRAKCLKLAIFSLGSLALTVNLAFLLSQLGTWDWAFITFIGSVSAVSVAVIVILAAFVTHVTSNTPWEEQDDNISDIDYDEKEKIQVAFPAQVDPYLFVDRSQTSVPIGFDIVVLSNGGVPSQDQVIKGSLDRTNSVSSIKSVESAKSASSRGNLTPPIKSKTRVELYSKPYAIPPPIIIPQRPVTETALNFNEGLESRFSATTMASSVLSGTESRHSHLSGPIWTGLSDLQPPTIPPLPQDISRFSVISQQSNRNLLTSMPRVNSRFSATTASSDDLFDGERRMIPN